MTLKGGNRVHIQLQYALILKLNSDFLNFDAVPPPLNTHTSNIAMSIVNQDDYLIKTHIQYAKQDDHMYRHPTLSTIVVTASDVHLTETNGLWGIISYFWHTSYLCWYGDLF